ncbi:MAG: hypothetical protein Kow00128_12970 [Deltaproteobacteria bacterium]
MNRMRNGKGFTLVEMMVAVAILGIAVAGIVVAFRSQVVSFHMQESVTDIQMNGTLVAMKLAQEARLAGYGIPKNTDDGTTTAVVAYVNNDASADGTDSITFRYCSGAAGYYYGTPPVSPNKTLTLSTTGFSVGDTVKVLNLSREDLFPTDTVTVTAVSGNDVTLSKGLWESAVPADLGVFVGVGMVDVKYDLVNAGTDNAALRRTITPVGGVAQPPEIVAFGVEDLQIAYGLDENLDLDVESYVNAPSAAQLKKVIALRISLIMRSDREDEQSVSGGQQAEDGNVRGGDNHRRRLFNTVVRIRNARVI